MVTFPEIPVRLRERPRMNRSLSASEIFFGGGCFLSNGRAAVGSTGRIQPSGSIDMTALWSPMRKLGMLVSVVVNHNDTVERVV